ncbi:MAG: PAS domain S-box protein [Phycisphaerae bacterium]
MNHQSQQSGRAQNERISQLEQEVLTLRKRLDDALEQASAPGPSGGVAFSPMANRFEAIFRNVGAGIVVARSDRRYVEVNDRFCEMTGYSRRELLGSGCGSLVHPSDQEEYLRLFGQLIDGSSDEFTTEFRSICKDGHSRWMRTTVKALRNDGQLHFLGAIEDVDQRKNMEAELECLVRLPKENPGPVLRLEADGTLLYANPAALEIMDNWSLEVDGPAPEALILPAREALRSAEPVVKEVALDGKYLQLRFHAQGRHVNIYGQDVTDRKEKEMVTLREKADAQILQQLSTRLIHSDRIDTLYQELVHAARQIMGADTATIQAYDPDTQELRLLAHHGIAPQLLNCCRALGRDDHTCCTAAARTGKRYLVADYTNDNSLVGRHSCKAHLDGGLHAGQSTPLLSREGKVLGVLSTHWKRPHRPEEDRLRLMDVLARQAADAIERAQAEQTLRSANDELERRVTERTAQLWDRSQQLRQLASKLTLAEQRERQRLSELLHDHLQQLLVGAKFRIEVLSGRVDPGSSELVDDLSDLLDTSIDCTRSLTRELSPPMLYKEGLGPALKWLSEWMFETHKMHIDLQGENLVVPLADDAKILLFQSVRELLFNSVKHSGTDTAGVSIMREKDGMTITVADDGAGFEPQTLTCRGEGNGGFGLFSIRERLDLLGGHMKIDSAPGQGSRFTLWLPVEQEPNSDG